MGFLDDIKSKADTAGDKAEDVFEAAKRQAVAAIDDLKARLDVNDDGNNTVGEVFAAAKAQASGAIDSLKDRVSGDDDTTVGDARVLTDDSAAGEPALPADDSPADDAMITDTTVDDSTVSDSTVSDSTVGDAPVSSGDTTGGARVVTEDYGTSDTDSTPPSGSPLT